ncbi:WD repeat-containing protein wat1 [Galdieria sulphuraria]|uniref:G protein beta subunit-like protein n=1 Tax=Galdieria sulphuraria TaxID=130081 RepID=M2Y259_GALSU|nr:G protein beta subunit-like protein [Galdieria sulphuraria]EME30058.1 G protein beta subunit-like protein [Galdieria sulphuraria]GJD06271.1 WD repeat-containing protein wat1 [Galdieria sulphuraria]|eukprot:XP_005706578.1 G protein beta subunit-like protein [Galdieria sulphuraria]
MGVKKLVSGGYDHTVRLWDPSTGVNERTFEFNDSQVNRLRFSKDGRLLAVCGNPRVAFFDLRSDAEAPVHTLDLHRSNVTDLVFRDAGPHAVTCSEDCFVYSWDLRVSNPVASLKNDSGVTSVGYGRNTGQVATTDYGRFMKIWDIEQQKVVGKMSTVTDNAMFLNLSYCSKTGLMCTTGSAGYAYICRITGAFTPGDDINKSSVVTNEGAKLDKAKLDLKYSNGLRRKKRHQWEKHLYNVPEEARGYFEKVAKFKCSNRYVLRCCFSDDGLLVATVADNGMLEIWGDENNPDVYTEDRWYVNRQIGRHQKWAWDCRFTKDAKHIFSCSSDKRICLWDANNGDILREYKGHQKAVTSIDVFST